MYRAEPRTWQVRQQIYTHTLSEWPSAFREDLPKALLLAPRVAPMLSVLGFRANNTEDVQNQYGELESLYEVPFFQHCSIRSSDMC